MVRKDALIRLHQNLLAKREALRARLDVDLDRSQKRGVGDLGDAAHDAEHNEVESQIVSLESRELRHVERAIALIRQGRYGICEACENSIPIERLKALPFTGLCVKCQRKQEEAKTADDGSEIDWESAYEFEGRMSHKELSLGDLDLD